MYTCKIVSPTLSVLASFSKLSDTAFRLHSPSFQCRCLVFKEFFTGWLDQIESMDQIQKWTHGKDLIKSGPPHNIGFMSTYVIGCSTVFFIFLLCISCCLLYFLFECVCDCMTNISVRLKLCSSICTVHTPSVCKEKIKTISSCNYYDTPCDHWSTPIVHILTHRH